MRACICRRKDLSTFCTLTPDPSLPPTDLLGAELSAVAVPPTSKWWQSAGLVHAAVLSHHTASDKPERKHECGACLLEAEVFYDTAERLALRRILPVSHPLHPPPLPASEAQSDVKPGSGHKRQSTADRLVRLRAMLADPALRASLPPMLASAAELYVGDDSVVHICDLTGEGEETEAWQASKRVKSERQHKRGIEEVL